MPLIDITSDLTSIKYGRDRRNGGSSGQPYFTKDIPERLQSMDFANSFLGSDFLIRGGVRSVSAVLDDEKRLSKWFSSFNSADGLLFIAKQNLLNRHRPINGTARPERLYTPLSTLGQAAVNNIGIHLIKDGLLPVLGDQQKYEEITRANNENWGGLGIGNNNRLLLLYETKITSPIVSTENIDLANVADRVNQGLEVYGATNSTDIINRAVSLGSETTAASGLFGTTLKNYGVSDSSTQLLNYQGGPNTLISGRSVVRRVFNTNDGFINNKNKKGINDLVGQYVVYSPDLIAKREQTKSTKFGDTGIKNFERDLSTIETSVSEKRRKELIGEPVDYTKFNRSSTFGEGDPGKKGRDRSLYYTTELGGTNSDDNEVFEYDKINAYPLYSSTNVATQTSDGKGPPDDYIKFNIGVINANAQGTFKDFTWLHFRSAINSFQDNYQATWNETKYMGRGNRFYTYDGFTRGISMGFDVIASSRYEQAFMYDKLNYLASVITPNYSDVGYMRGNIIKLTVGDYLNNVYGILKSITYSIPQESPWDIGRKNDGSKDNKNHFQLPHYIQVSNFEFIPIHSFRESLVPTSYVNGTKTDTLNYISMGSNQEGQALTQERRKLYSKV